jgi:hypothetical protein
LDQQHEKLGPQLKSIRDNVAHIDRKTSGFISRQTCRDMISDELRGGLNANKAISSLQSQMDKLRLSIKNMPRARADEGRVRPGGRQPWSRHSTPSQELATAGSTQLSNHDWELVNADEENIDKV